MEYIGELRLHGARFKEYHMTKKVDLIGRMDL